MSSRRLGAFFFACAVVFTGAITGGCSAGKGDEPGGPGKLDPSGGDAGTSGWNVDDGGASGDGFTPGPGTDGGGGSCAAQSVKATESVAPIDLIWVVDSSGSMDNEAKRVQDNLNGFSEAMGKVGLDWRVVVITSSSFVKVPPPLGTSPNFMFIDRMVNSSEPLEVLLAEHAKYGSFLRPYAVTHIVAVTDDESDLGAEDFYKQMHAKLGLHFKFHAIASEKIAPTFTNPTGACQTTSGFPPEGAAAPGVQYYKLADATGGLKFSICTSDWTGLFSTLTKAVAVAAKLPCQFVVPKPTDGKEVDPGKVNVDWTKGSGGVVNLVFVPGGKDACPPTGGWYYDDPKNPTRILLCPTTCDAVSKDTTGKVDIALGCATRIK